MYIFRYKKLWLLLLICTFCFSVKAQQTHFVYLQTDNGQPFYVKLDNKVISSSAEGYVILPNITEGNYQIAVGFPKKEHPEEKFSLKAGNNNEGFVIKNFADKGMQLFNLQTLALINGASDSGKTADAPVKKDSDAFSTMLAGVVKDSSILQNHQVQSAPQVVAKVDSSTAAKPDSSNVANKSAATIVPVVKPGPVAKNDSVSKILSNENESGLTMLYSDTDADKTDTISVFIPAQNDAAPQEETKAVVENKNADNSAPAAQVQTDFTITPTVIKPAKENSGFVFRKDSVVENNEPENRPVQVFTIGPAKEKATGKKEEASESNEEAIRKTSKENNPSEGQMILLPKVVTSSKVNSDCKTFASNGDFLRLRKKMAAENSSEDMIKVARKYFRNACFSTEQIKDLSYLFLDDKGRYMFFDAAYPHTSDSDQYQLLESQLTDQYYINRFQAMIRK
jgi:hypothetical protein